MQEQSIECSQTPQMHRRWSDFSQQQVFDENKLWNQRKMSYIEVMQVEGSEIFQKDLFDQMAFQEKRNSMMRSSNNSRVDRFENQIQEQRFSGNARFSRYSRNSVNHTCACIGNCVYSHCPCSDKIIQKCLPGICCPSCVIAKEKSISLLAQGCQSCRQHKSLEIVCQCVQEQKQCNFILCRYRIITEEKRKKIVKKNELKKNQNLSSFKVCLCKKSHCLKKYCECYASGGKCNSKCRCEDCYNKDNSDEDEDKDSEKERYARIEEKQNSDDQIDKYLEQKDYSKMDLPESMQFTPVNFKRVSQR